MSATALASKNYEFHADTKHNICSPCLSSPFHCKSAASCVMSCASQSDQSSYEMPLSETEFLPQSASSQSLTQEMIASMLDRQSHDVSTSLPLLRHLSHASPFFSQQRFKRKERDWPDMVDDCSRSKRIHTSAHEPSRLKASPPPVTASSSQPRKSQAEDSTKRIIKILSRMVLSQNEKFLSLQQRSSHLEVENDQLRDQVQQLNEQAQQLKQQNSTLQYYLASSGPRSYGDFQANRDVF